MRFCSAATPDKVAVSGEPLPAPGVPQFLRVQAADHDNLVVIGYGDGEEHFEIVSVSSEERTLPTENKFDTYELEFIGTSRVQRAQAAETIEEID